MMIMHHSHTILSPRIRGLDIAIKQQQIDAQRQNGAGQHNAQNREDKGVPADLSCCIVCSRARILSSCFRNSVRVYWSSIVVTSGSSAYVPRRTADRFSNEGDVELDTGEDADGGIEVAIVEVIEGDDGMEELDRAEEDDDDGVAEGDEEVVGGGDGDIDGDVDKVIGSTH